MSRILIAICLWGIILLAAGAAIYKLWWVPSKVAQKASEQQAKQKEVLAKTSADPTYKYNLRMNVDGFSGYSVIRSQDMQNYLRKRNIKLDLVDDQANYVQRLKSLQSGETQMAVFTIDALIKASAEIGDTPATIVGVIDETKGADAIVAYKKQFPNLDSLNDPDVKFVLTPDSPSETLVRVMLASFQFDQLTADPFIKVSPTKGAEAVYDEYRKSAISDKKVYVVWQPWGTRVLDNPNTHILIDSSRFKGYIVDVFVANRDYLYKSPEVVQAVMESYLRATYDNRDKLVDLVIEDARKGGSPLSQKQAQDLVSGIWFKNTQENYAHYGLGNVTLQNIEDMILNLTRVLIKTNGIKADPTKGHPELLYYPGIVQTMYNSSFHPGFAPEDVRSEAADVLPTLTDQQWQRLIPVGTLEVPKLVFARGTAKLSEASAAHLDALYDQLKTFPTYYVLVKGNASTIGDLEMNKALAIARADVAKEYLTQKGIAENRIRAMAGIPTGETSVTFVLGESTY